MDQNRCGGGWTSELVIEIGNHATDFVEQSWVRRGVLINKVVDEGENKSG